MSAVSEEYRERMIRLLGEERDRVRKLQYEAGIEFECRELERKQLRTLQAAARQLLADLPRCDTINWETRDRCAATATRGCRGTPDTGGGQEPMEYYCDHHWPLVEDDLDWATAVRVLRGLVR